MHLSLEAALDLIEGRLDSSELRFWTAHIENCKECSEQMEQSRQMHDLMIRDHLENAPQWLMEQAVSIFRKPQVVHKSGVRKVLASLVFDSFAMPMLAGARGVMDARQLVLRAEAFDIHLKIWGEQEHRHLMGQILSRDDSAFSDAAKLHLLRNGERLETTATDSLGEFQFRDIPQGLISLQVDLPHLTVVGALNMLDTR
jgi:hypothetical protein